MEEFIKTKKGALISSIIATFLWGSAIPMIKTLYIAMDLPSSDLGSQILLAGLRFFIAGLLTIVYMKIFSREKVRLGQLNWKFLFIIGMIQIFIQYSFFYIGLSNIQGVKAAVIQATNAMITVILAVALIRTEHMTPRKFIALILGTAGVLLVNLGGDFELSFALNAEGAILASTFLNSLATVLVRKYGGTMSAFVISIGQFIVGSIPLIILGIFLSGWQLSFSPMTLALLLYGSFISATAFTIWVSLLKHHGPSEVGIYKLFIPIFGSLTSALFLGEALTVNLIIGLAFVIGGSIIINRRSKVEIPEEVQ